MKTVMNKITRRATFVNFPAAAAMNCRGLSVEDTTKANLFGSHPTTICRQPAASTRAPATAEIRSCASCWVVRDDSDKCARGWSVLFDVHTVGGALVRPARSKHRQAAPHRLSGR